MSTQSIIITKKLKIVRQGNEILKGIDLNMTADQHLAIIGSNGAGKTFLLRILSADIIPSSGEVEIFGKKFGKISLWDLRKMIGFVSTRLAYWYGDKSTVTEVIGSGFHGTLGLPEELTDDQKDKISDLLNFFHLVGFEDRIFDTLSDGEKRRVLLSRALVLEPKLLIFDEPCQGLDIPTREIFLEDVNRLATTIPIIYVTHHLEELPSCISDVIFLKKGKVYAQGPKAKMLNSENMTVVFDYDLEVEKKGDRYYVRHIE